MKKTLLTLAIAALLRGGESGHPSCIDHVRDHGLGRAAPRQQDRGDVAGDADRGGQLHGAGHRVDDAHVADRVIQSIGQGNLTSHRL